MFINGGEVLTQSLLQMAYSLKRMESVPVNWSRMCIQTLKKKTGSTRKLSSYCGIFLVPVLSIIFETLLKNRYTPHLEENMTQFQTGGVKFKGVVDNLFILTGTIYHSKYLGNELWITFYDIKKCFNSLWLEDFINCLWRSGVKDDILYLVFQLSKKAMITVRTPFGNIKPFQINNIVKQVQY